MNQSLRLILAFGLSMLIMFLYSTYVAPPMTQKDLLKNSTTSATTQDISKENTSQTTSLQADEPNTQNKVAVADADETKAEEKTITVQTDLTDVVLSTKGGVIKEYHLKKYRKGVEKDSELTNLIPDSDSSALFLGLDGYAGFDSNHVFAVTKDTVNRDNDRIIELTWQNSEVRLVKTFTFNSLPSKYAVKIDYEVSNVSGAPLELTPYIESELTQKQQPPKTGILSFLKSRQTDLYNREFFMDKKLNTAIQWDKFDQPENTTGAIQWTGLSDRYFLVAVAQQQMMTDPVLTHFERRGNLLLNRFEIPKKILKAGEVLSGSLVSYIGPKELSQLKLLQLNLERAVDYGWFSILAVPILWLMTFLHKVIPNWGLVIITLTFLVKLALHPINKKSMQSMKGMQQLQPKLQEIKKKYPDDREKQNHEIMNLFKTHKVNPMGGCLPMMLQMPIYIVLYKVLWNSIELYHAPFFGVYKDLSAPDPYFILPVLLGVFMFLQQKLTPAATADNSQQKMMMFMPIMFTGFMLFLPVGLVTYIFVNTVMSVIQQFMIKRDLSFKQFVTGKWQPNGA